MATTASIFVKSIIQGSLLTTMHQMKFLSTNCLNMQKSECLKESRDRVPRQTWLAGLVAEYPCNHDTEHTLRDTSRQPRDLLRRASRGFFSSTLNIRYSMGSSCWQDETPGNIKSQKTVFILNAKLSLYSRKLWRDSDIALCPTIQYLHSWLLDS